jgi:hypothetical protein
VHCSPAISYQSAIFALDEGSLQPSYQLSFSYICTGVGFTEGKLSAISHLYLHWRRVHCRQAISYQSAILALVCTAIRCSKVGAPLNILDLVIYIGSFCFPPTLTDRW